jgi:hypothetical protein
MSHPLGPAHPEGTLAELRTRLISIRSMERPLRLITGFGVAMLLASGLLVALRDVTMPQVGVDYVDGRLTTMGLATFITSLAFVSLAWAYLLAGIAHIRAVLRVPGLVLFTLAMGWQLREGLTAAGTAAVAGAFALVWATVLAGLLVRRWRPREGRGQLAPVLVPLLFAEVALIYAATWLGQSIRDQFAFTVASDLSTFAQFLVPVLVLAGADLAELADLLSAGVASTVARIRPRHAVTAATVAVAAAVIVVVRMAGTDLLAQAAPATALAAVVVCTLLIRRRQWHVSRRSHVPMLATAVAAVAVGFFLVVPVLTFSLFPPMVAATAPSANGLPTSVVVDKDLTLPLAQYRRDAVPRFGLSYPEIWQVVTDLDEGPQGRTVIEFNGQNVKDAAFYLVAAVALAGHPDEDATFQSLFDTHVCTGGCTATVSNSRTVGQDTVSDLHLTFTSGGTGTGIVRLSTHDGFRWWRMAISSAALVQFNQPIFAAIDGTFTTSPSRATPDQGTSPVVAAATLNQQRFSAAEECVALLAVFGAVLMLVRRRMQPWASRDTGLMFMLIAAGLFALHNVGDLATALGRSRIIPLLDVEGIRGLLAIASLAALAYCLVLRRRQLPHLAVRLLTLNVGLQLVAWTIDLYSGTPVGGHFSLAEAGVIVVALLFDVVMSGDSITNRDGGIFPRHARVLLFLGYLVMTAVAVTFFSSEHVQATQATVEAQFDSERWVQFGLTLLGPPLLLTLFILRRRNNVAVASSGTLRSEAVAGSAE